jgi:hypothetical protein
VQGLVRVEAIEGCGCTKWYIVHPQQRDVGSYSHGQIRKNKLTRKVKRRKVGREMASVMKAVYPTSASARGDKEEVVQPSAYVACLFVRNRKSGASPDSAHAFFRNSCFNGEEAGNTVRKYNVLQVHYKNAPQATHPPSHGSSHPHTSTHSGMI